LDTQLKSLETLGYATLPPSGKIPATSPASSRHIVLNHPGCRILHLALPVHPTPTTYARFAALAARMPALDLDRRGPRAGRI